MPNKSESARINGSKSKGPITPEGKAKSSQNALRHGLTASFTVLSHESPDDFDLLLDAHVHRFQPADAVEMELVHAMATTRWRLRRIVELEASLLDNEIVLAHADIDDDFDDIDDDGRLAYAFKRLAGESHAMTLLMRYEASLNRQYDRALKQLDLLQKRPLPNEPTDPLTPDFPAPSPRPAPPADESPRHSSQNPCHSPVSASLPAPPVLCSISNEPGH